jgi:hypothetical protein
LPLNNKGAGKMTNFKFFTNKYQAISTTKSMIALLIEELEKNDQEDFEIWIAAEHLKNILEKWENEKYKI